jgi:thiol-disulfide isomerase/thioredoxin
MGGAARNLVSRRRLLLAGALSALAFVAALTEAFVIVPRLLDQRAFADVDRTIAPFSLRTLDGEPINSKTWRGRVVVVWYWATWCPPCLAEMSELSALQSKYRSDPRVAIVALNAGTGGDTAQKAREFLDRRHFDVSTDIDDIKQDRRKQGEAAVRLGPKVVPTLFILNKDQKLVAVHAGFDSAERFATTLSKRIDSLIKP